jgi:hypothetical protein
MKVLTIDRSKWRRGQGTSQGDDRAKAGIGLGVTMLLNSQGYMCCLGFDALACGVSKGLILEQPDPDEFLSQNVYDSDDKDELRELLGEAVYDIYRNRFGSDDNSRHPVARAMKVNDIADLTEAEREAQLIPILKELGWDDVVFVDSVKEAE